MLSLSLVEALAPAQAVSSNSLALSEPLRCTSRALTPLAGSTSLLNPCSIPPTMATTAKSRYLSLSQRVVAICMDESVALPSSPYFDSRMGSVPGPNRVEAEATLEDIRLEMHSMPAAGILAEVIPAAPMDPKQEISIVEQRRWYGEYLAFEVALGSICLDSVDVKSTLREAVTYMAWREAACLVDVKAHQEKVHQSRSTLAVLLVPLAVRCAAHVDCGPAVLPFAKTETLDIVDRTDYWSRFFREERDLVLPAPPPEVELGERSLKRSRNASTLPMISRLPWVVDDDATRCLRNDTSDLVAWLAALRAKIPEVAPVKYDETRLRDWGEAKASVLGMAIAVIISRLNRPRQFEEAVGHAVPAALTLVQSYDDSTRADLGLSSVLSILQKFAPSDLANYEGLIFENLIDIRSICHEDPECAALIGRCFLRLVSMLDSPKARRTRAAMCVQISLVDCVQWRVEACRLEVLRWRLCPAMLLHLGLDPAQPFAICAYIRRLVPALVAVIASRGPGPPMLLALRSLHATAALAWPRLKGHFLENLVAAALAAGRKAHLSLKKQSPDQPFARYAPLVLAHVERLLALLLILAPSGKANDDSAAYLLATAVKRFPDVANVVKRAIERAKRRRN